MDRNRRARWLLLSLLGLAFAGVGLPAAHQTVARSPTAPAVAAVGGDGLTRRVSIALDGGDPNGPSHYPNISADGRYVVYHSAANNLVPADENFSTDVFIFDATAGLTTRVSLSSAQEEANAASAFPDLTADGRFVVFHSIASNLVEGDDNDTWDIFVRDGLASTTERITISPGGEGGNDLSLFPAISADGRYVAFYSLASNLVPQDNNEAWDVFVRDRQTGITERVSVDSAGNEAAAGSSFPDISASGRYVVFGSAASDLVPGDLNNYEDVFLRDRLLGATVRISIGFEGSEPDGDSLYPTITADGRYVTFSSRAANLVPEDNNALEDVFLFDRQTGVTIRLSQSESGAEANGGSHYPAISEDGRFVLFHSDATNLVPDDNNQRRDMFVYSVATGHLARVSLSAAGEEGSGDSSSGDISADGCYVVFHSDAPNLVPDDLNQAADIFRRYLCSPHRYLFPIVEWGQAAQSLLSQAQPSLSPPGHILSLSYISLSIFHQTSNPPDCPPCNAIRRIAAAGLRPPRSQSAAAQTQPPTPPIAPPRPPIPASCRLLPSPCPKNRTPVPFSAQPWYNTCYE